MHRRYNLAHFILANIVALGLSLLIVEVEVQARIAFVSQRDGNPEIYMMTADGKNQRRLTKNHHGDSSPSWSPDGKRIAFESQRDGNAEIYVMDADGKNQRRLTKNHHGDSSPSWSPDGKRIAFTSDRDWLLDKDGWPTNEIYVMDADGKNQQRLTENPSADWHPSWSPDGERIAFASQRAGNAEIYVMDADGQNRRRLTENRRNDWYPSWSPDGERIAFASQRAGNVEIYVMDADGKNRRRLTNNRHDDTHPAWFNPALAVAPAGKILTMWGWLKQDDQ